MALLFGYNSGEISGVIKDPSGAVAADVMIGVKDKNGNTVRTTSRTAKEDTAWRALPEGNYTVEVTREGFQKIVARDVATNGNDQNTFTLSPGATSQTVEVVAVERMNVQTSGGGARGQQAEC